MFICQFFNGNPNFEVTRVTKAMLRVKVNNENGIFEKNELLPVLVPGVVVLMVRLDP